jgi:hypothetical protein
MSIWDCFGHWPELLIKWVSILFKVLKALPIDRYKGLPKMTKQTPDDDWIEHVHGFSLFARVPMQVIFDKSLSKSEIRVLLCIIAHANKSGSTYFKNKSVSQARIAEMCTFLNKGKAHPNEVSGIVKSLVIKKWVVIMPSGGVNNTNYYQLTIPEDLQIPEVSDRNTSEYLTAAVEKRDKVYAKYEREGKSKLAPQATKTIELYDDDTSISYDDDAEYYRQIVDFESQKQTETVAPRARFGFHGPATDEELLDNFGF